MRGKSNQLEKSSSQQQTRVRVGLSRDENLCLAVKFSIGCRKAVAVVFHLYLSEANFSRADHARGNLNCHFLMLSTNVVLVATEARVSARHLVVVVLVVANMDTKWQIIPIALTALVSQDSYLEHHTVQMLAEGSVSLPTVVENLFLALEVMIVSKVAVDLQNRLAVQLIRLEFIMLQAKRHKPLMQR